MTPDPKETVMIEMAAGDRIRLDTQIADRMEQLGFGRYQFAKLGLGFNLPANWPADMNSQLTLPQLSVLAWKLKMQIVIDNLDLIPLKEGDTK